MTPLPLLPPLVPGGNPILLLDNSTLDLYNSCPREGEYGHIDNWVSASDKEALNFGAAAHEGWKWRYQHCGTKDLNCCSFDHNGIESVGANAIQNDIIQQWFSAHPQPLDSFRSPSLCLELMARYNERYQDETFEIVANPKTGKPCVEQSVMVFLGTLQVKHSDITHTNVDIYYTGRIDLIISTHEGIWILDHKTTFQFGSSFTNQMSMSAQFIGYAWAVQQAFGINAIGYIINAIRVRKPTDKALLAEDFFRVRGSDSDFARIPFYITQENIDEWKINTLALALTILYHHSQQYFPMNRTQCQRKWGACQFFEVCNTAREHRQQILQSEAFMQNEWSPLNQPVIDIK